MSEEKTTKKRRWRISRRGFLIGAGVTGGVAALGIGFGLPALRLALARQLDNAAAPGGVSAPPTAWFDILADNRVHIYVPKVEMGQGIHTALGQIAAEELEVEWEQVEVLQASTARGLEDGFGTGASNSVSNLYTPLREAAATFREMLRAEAAVQLGVSGGQLVAKSGVFRVSGDEETAVSYGELVASKTDWEIPEEAPALKPASQFRMIGQPLKRVDFKEKLLGNALYGYDMRLPGMLYGAVARPETVNGKLMRATAGDVASRDGVVQVVIEDEFAGVVAESRTAAYQGVNNLELEWDAGQLWQQAELEEMVTVGNGTAVVIQREGSPRNNLEGNNVVTAEYRTPMAVHAHLEPQAALVDVQPGKVQAWVSTQSPDLVRGEIASALGRDETEVEVLATYLGGGFGRRLNVNVAIEAAKLSAAVGKPVHMGWNRTEEMRNGYVRPPTHNVLRAVLNDNGKMTAMEHQQASGDVAFPFFPALFIPVLGADFGAWRGAPIFYGGIPHRRTIAHRIDMPIATGWWRGLGLLANTFALESFVDEVAHAANADPLQFRLDHLTTEGNDLRFRNALQAAAEAADWGSAPPAGRARGVACSTDVNTIVAQIAEVSVENGRIRVHKVVSAMDPGLVINPDGASAQSQGSIIMGLSSTFKEKLTIADGVIEPRNFDTYPLITMADAPEIEIKLLESGDQPFGVGEPPMGPIAAAVANATFALTGQRLRTLPLTLS